MYYVPFVCVHVWQTHGESSSDIDLPICHFTKKAYFTGITMSGSKQNNKQGYVSSTNTFSEYIYFIWVNKLGGIAACTISFLNVTIPQRISLSSN
uniref:Uncharacterized protein n=1 Tax=Pyxicephalus adspersus TaxID=30357 RepID=A0AAV3B6Z4_PYXAD|nr:TPA: hypothetical protein GDO54_006874 [Pyxicephalus adspersus]